MSKKMPTLHFLEQNLLISKLSIALYKTLCTHVESMNALCPLQELLNTVSSLAARIATHHPIQEISGEEISKSASGEGTDDKGSGFKSELLVFIINQMVPFDAAMTDFAT